MQKKDGLTKGLAIVGTVLIWMPLVLPVFLAVMRYARARMLYVDYFIPAEVFPVVAVGAVLLVWAALRARARRKLIGWGMGIALAALVLSQVVAVLTGLASGAIEPAGWQWALVLGLYALYPLALIAVGIGGILLVRDLFRPAAP